MTRRGPARTTGTQGTSRGDDAAPVRINKAGGDYFSPGHVLAANFLTNSDSTLREPKGWQEMKFQMGLEDRRQTQPRIFADLKRVAVSIGGRTMLYEEEKRRDNVGEHDREGGIMKGKTYRSIETCTGADWSSGSTTGTRFPTGHSG